MNNILFGFVIADIMMDMKEIFHNRYIDRAPRVIEDFTFIYNKIRIARQFDYAQS
jgi:hypothetical protein